MLMLTQQSSEDGMPVFGILYNITNNHWIVGGFYKD